MEIKDFVSETLIQINEAMKDTKQKTGVSHSVSRGVKGGQGVSFSLAVTNSDNKESSKGGKAGLSIKVLEAKLDSSGKSNSSSETVSRIEFTVRPDY
jgi:hypothetical protein